ncbi:MAG: tRNA (adenosine(37)-N6)-threonylcarbamoyltransferase complex transferase subunit TsaD [Candidatus Levybacteria bacterium]|nr:tRNA (adenosine(37)-N6)-threonylcarbamoyltransferase complex transferase subunit TsaD [Candidatus Levybacteria bacterium]
MKILAIETSCDETGAAVVSKNLQENYVKVLSNIITSSLVLHAKTGGIIPDIAAREQLKFIIPVIEKSIENCKLKIANLDAIAVTVGPGLIGSLLIGVETTKTLSYLWNKPIIPVNHLLGHIYANFIRTINHKPSTINFPALCLLVSGGHTDLILLKSHSEFKWLGGTLDDAAGEAFDKIGRLLSLPYPGGPAIEKYSKRGTVGRFTFPSPMIYSKDFNFSFSGLKAAVTRDVKKIKNMDEQTKADIAISVQEAITGVLVKKTINAAKKYSVKSILLGGGVAANQNLQNELKLQIENCKLKIAFFAPEKSLCTDNAAMIGAYAAFHYKPAQWKNITADPELYFYD